MADTFTERRFFGEVIISANLVRHLGTPEQQVRARELLERFADGDDPMLADLGRWAMSTPPSEERLAEWYPNAGRL